MRVKNYMFPVASLSQCLCPTASDAICCIPPPPLTQTPLPVTVNEGNKPGKRLKNTQLYNRSTQLDNSTTYRAELLPTLTKDKPEQRYF